MVGLLYAIFVGSFIVAVLASYIGPTNVKSQPPPTRLKVLPSLTLWAAGIALFSLLILLYFAHIELSPDSSSWNPPTTRTLPPMDWKFVEESLYVGSGNEIGKLFNGKLVLYIPEHDVLPHLKILRLEYLRQGLADRNEILLLDPENRDDFDHMLNSIADEIINPSNTVIVIDEMFPSGYENMSYWDRPDSDCPQLVVLNNISCGKQRLIQSGKIDLLIVVSFSRYFDRRNIGDPLMFFGSRFECITAKNLDAIINNNPRIFDCNSEESTID